MDRDVKNDMIAAWRCLAAFLIYPITIFPGLHAVSLVVSSLCVTARSWSLEGAVGNLFLGLPAIFGIVALWCSVIIPYSVQARNRRLFVFVASGLMAGLVLEGLFLRANLSMGPGQAFRLSLIRAWLFLAPPLVGIVNLVLLIGASQAEQREAMLIRVRGSDHRHADYPRHHLPESPVQEPVVLKPYRPGRSG